MGRNLTRATDLPEKVTRKYLESPEKDTFKLSHALGHVSDLVLLQPSQVLSYPFSPIKAFLTLKKVQQNEDERDTYAIGHFFAANGKLVFSILASI